MVSKYFLIVLLFATQKCANSSTSEGFPFPALSPSELYSMHQKGSAELTNYRLDNPKRSHSRWPKAVVNYTLDTSFSRNEENVQLFSLVKKEFEDKTCIRFRESTVGNYVSIEKFDNKSSSCGAAPVCMRGGYQYVRVNSHCVDKRTLVRELGHTLCLTHEHWRKDRDNYLNFEHCSKNEKEIRDIYNNTELHLHLMYDYASQMNSGYECPCEDPRGGQPKIANWPGCQEYKNGQRGYLDGLSVLDADTVNILYGCGGCHRHRWRPITNLNQNDYLFMYDFGHVDELGNSLYPCRALIPGEVAVGVYRPEENACYVPSRFGTKTVKVTKDAEVLTIPGGYASCNLEGRYQLANVLTESRENLLKFGVPAGNGWSLSGSTLGRTFIAFGGMRWEQYKSPRVANSELMEGSVVDNIGSVWEWGLERIKLEGLFTTKNEGVGKVEDVNILICK